MYLEGDAASRRGHLGPLDLGRISIDGHHRVAERGQTNSQPTIAAAGIDDPRGAGEIEQPKDLCRLEVGAVIGQVADMEPMVHLQERCVVVTHDAHLRSSAAP